MPGRLEFLVDITEAAVEVCIHLRTDHSPVLLLGWITLRFFFLLHSVEIFCHALVFLLVRAFFCVTNPIVNVGQPRLIVELGFLQFANISAHV